jgi:hypothetical protein
MQETIVRIYDDPSCCHVSCEHPISRGEALAEILAGFRAAGSRDAPDDGFLKYGRSLQWAGYERFRAAAPVGQPHFTRVQSRPAVGGHRYEYIFLDGLKPDECDELCLNVVGEDGADGDGDHEREWLVTSTLASVLHAGGVSLADYVLDYARGKTVLVDGLTLVPPTMPATLYTAVRDRGWSDTVEWLHTIQALLEQGLNEVRMGRAVWVPASAPRQPWEPLILQYCAGRGCLRLAFGAEAATYAGWRTEIAVSTADLGDWMTDREAQKMAGMSNGQWRRWIESHRQVRVGRPITPDGRLAKNRRLVHRGDHRRELRMVQNDGEEICNPTECPQRCYMARNCPHRDHRCPG